MGQEGACTEDDCMKNSQMLGLAVALVTMILLIIVILNRRLQPYGGEIRVSPMSAYCSEQGVNQRGESRWQCDTASGHARCECRDPSTGSLSTAEYQKGGW